MRNEGKKGASIICYYQLGLEQYKDQNYAEKERDKLLEDSKDTTKNKGDKTKNHDKSGGDKKAQEDFDKMKLKDVREIDTTYGKGKMGYDSDGNKVIYRPGSKSGGSTVEIKLPKGHSVKIRYK